MPAHASPASVQAIAVAPDGIAIHQFAVPAAVLVGVTEGRIPSGSYAIHRHLSLEQYTYVISGRVTAITSAEEHPAGRSVTLQPGDLLLTAPWESLQFVNESTETARVLFICAPPYPADDADTRTLDEHAPLTAPECADAITRLKAVRDQVLRAIDARIATLRRNISG